MEWWRSVVRWLGGREPAVLLSVLVVVSATWALFSIASEVIEGDTLALDRKVVRSMRRADDASIPIGPGWVKEVGRDVTALGSHSAVVLIVSVVAGFLLLDRPGDHSLNNQRGSGSDSANDLIASVANPGKVQPAALYTRLRRRIPRAESTSKNSTKRRPASVAATSEASATERLSVKSDR